MFVDIARIKVKSGNGGNGAVTFRREKYVNAGGPDGGDGGRGGDVVLQVDDNLSTLVDFKYKRKYIAQNGQDGSGRNCTGKSAEPLVIRVPRGTLVKEANSGKVIADMSSSEPFVLVRGGHGGKGNQHFATATRQIPRFSKPAGKGVELEVTLELKLLADVGLVGFPNVGKSTLISVVSSAKPQIANYHFTTLTPVLGVVKIEEGNSFVMADIPGLIEGASEGVGLGHQFLRHVDRCRLIVHVVDVSGIEGRDPIEDFETINKELANFNEELATRPQIVAANKSDMATPEQIEAFKEYIEQKGYRFYEISAATTMGVKQLVDEIAKQLVDLPPIKRYEIELDPMAQAELEDKQAFTIYRDDQAVFVVEAPFLEPIMETINPEDYSSLQYFSRVLRSSGIIDKLEEMGINENDTVKIFDFEFDYIR